MLRYGMISNIANNMYMDAYLNKLKLTRSDGRKTVVMARKNRPALSTMMSRSTPAVTPIQTDAQPMVSAATTLENAIANRVTASP